MDTPRERIKEQAARAQDVYSQGVEHAREFAEEASQKSKQAVTYTDEWVHANPWLALGVVAGVGLLLGILMAESLRES